MAPNPYALCPCGSGKKLKFCCGDIQDDLDRFRKLAGQQPAGAEALIRQLIRRHPDKENLLLELSNLIDRQGRIPEIRELLANFLKSHPDNPRILARLAFYCVMSDGFENSRRILHRALQIASKVCAEDMARIVGTIGIQFSGARIPMASREHLALAVRLAAPIPEMSKGLLQALAAFERDSSIPLPLRSSHALLPVAGTDEVMQQDLRARKLSLIGCWEPAAILYARMAEANPNDGATWFNLGLCRAWDARSLEAAEALHKAAVLLPDWESSVEAETLAQLLEVVKPGQNYSVSTVRFPAHNLSELVSKLENHDRILKFSIDDFEEENSENEYFKIGEYEVYDRPITTTATADVASVPRSVAEIEVFDVMDETADQSSAGPVIQISGPDFQREEAIAILKSLGDNLIDFAAEQKIGRSLSAMMAAKPFDFGLFRAHESTGPEYRRLLREAIANALEDWLKTPAATLDGKTPLEASQIPEMRVRLAGFVNAVRMAVTAQDKIVDENDILDRLGLPRFTRLKIGESQHVLHLSVQNLMRLIPSELNDQQLSEFVSRCGMLGMIDQTRTGLDVLFGRPECLEEFGVFRACMMRASIARADDDLSKIDECFNRARKHCENKPDAFRQLLEIDIRELAMRLDDRTDPGIIPILHHLRDKVIRKLPDVYGLVVDQLHSTGCEHLLPELEPQSEVGAGVSGGLWTPETAQKPEASGSSPLWLPGQD